MGIFDKLKGTLPMTTSFSFDGYKIDEYLGVFSGESALGTGFLSSIGASLADTFGTDSSMYSGKIGTARQNALNVLQLRAKMADGNAIIGVDLKMTAFSADIIGIIATGTVVRISKIDGTADDLTETPDSKVLEISHTQKDLPFRPVSVSLFSYNDKTSELNLDVFCSENISLDGILTNTTLITIFDEKFSLPDIEFLSFSRGKRFHFISEHTPCSIPDQIKRTVRAVDIQVKKYILNGALYTCDLPMEHIDLSDIVETNMTDSTDALLDQEKEAESFLIDIDALTSSRKILDYAVSFNESHQNMVAPALLELIESTARTERLYGNNKRETINKVQSYLKEHPLFE